MVRALLAGLLGLLVNAQAENWLMAPMTFANLAFWLYCGMILGAVGQSGFQPTVRRRFGRIDGGKVSRGRPVMVR